MLAFPAMLSASKAHQSTVTIRQLVREADAYPVTWPPPIHARMKQSDHSMLPPTPAATIAFGSPNACNDCHGDKSAAWADEQVRRWHSKDYQAPVLKRARLCRRRAKRGLDKISLTCSIISRAKTATKSLRQSLIRCMVETTTSAFFPFF